MTSPPAAAEPAASPRPDPQELPEATPKGASLRVLERPPRRGRLWRVLSACLVAGALLAVVIGHSMLAQGEVRLTKIQSQVSTEAALNRQLLAWVGSAENPARIVAEAKGLGLFSPGSVTQIPAVPLDAPLGSAGAASSPTSSGR